MEVVTDAEVVHLYVRKPTMALVSTIKFHVKVKYHMLHLGIAVGHF